MHFDDHHFKALMQVYADLCFKIQFEDKITLTSDLLLQVDGVRDYKYSLSQVVYQGDKDTWLPVRHDVSVQTETQENQLNDGNGIIVDIKEEGETEKQGDTSITEVTPSSPESCQGVSSRDDLTDINCPLCSEQFQDESGMSKHLQDRHDIGNMYVCTVCQKVCWSNKYFIQHMKEHQSQAERGSTRSDRRKQTPKKVERGEIKLVLQENINALLKQDDTKVTFKNVMKGKGVKKEKTKSLTKLKSVKGKSRKRTGAAANKEAVEKKVVKTVQADDDDLTEEDYDSDKTEIDNQDYVETYPDYTAKVDKIDCVECGKSYCSKRALRRHVATMHLEKRHICDFCGQCYKGRDSLNRHIRALHKKEKIYKCTMPGCDEKFNFNHSLKLHLLKHSGERPHACTICFKTYLTAHHLKVHYQAVHADSKNFVCRFCGKKFSYSTSHKMHERTHSDSKNRPFPCEHCDKSFVNRQALKYHVMAKHSLGHYKCEICNKVYKSEFLLKSHRRRHTDDSTRFMCDICGNRFMYKSTLELHKSVHKDAKDYQCKICGKTFKTYPTLYSHQYVHKEGNPFQCPVCNKAFKTKERCKAHERRHTGLKPFECSLCHHRFPDKGGLQKHLKTVHCSVKKFVCDICGKATSRADNLRVHMKVHGKPGFEPKIRKVEKGSMIPNIFDSDTKNSLTDAQRKKKVAAGYDEDFGEHGMSDVMGHSNSSDMFIHNSEVNNFTTMNSDTVGSQNNRNNNLSNMNSDPSDHNRIPNIAQEHVPASSAQHSTAEGSINLPVQIVQTQESPVNPITAHSFTMPTLQPAYVYPWSYMYQASVQQNQTGSNAYFQ